jgi:hypothetical protein
MATPRHCYSERTLQYPTVRSSLDDRGRYIRHRIEERYSTGHIDLGML